MGKFIVPSTLIRLGVVAVVTEPDLQHPSSRRGSVMLSRPAHDPMRTVISDPDDIPLHLRLDARDYLRALIKPPILVVIETPAKLFDPVAEALKFHGSLMQTVLGLSGFYSAPDTRDIQRTKDGASEMLVGSLTTLVSGVLSPNERAAKYVQWLIGLLGPYPSE